MTNWSPEEAERLVRLALARAGIAAAEADVAAAAAQLRAVLARLEPLDEVPVGAEEPMDLDWEALR
jgi:hypothetical protein